MGAPASGNAPQNTAAAPAVSGPTGGTAGADPALEAAVGKQVDDKNAAEARDTPAFSAAGWTLVDNVAPPDTRVLGFDPTLQVDAPDVLRVQLSTTLPTDSDVGHIATIVRQAATPELRLAAVEALGHAPSSVAQTALLATLQDATFASDVAARHVAVALVRPHDLDDQNAKTAALLLDSSALDDTDKAQLAFTLAAIGLRDGMQLPAGVLATLSADAQARLVAMTALARMQK